MVELRIRLNGAALVQNAETVWYENNSVLIQHRVANSRLGDECRIRLRIALRGANVMLWTTGVIIGRCDVARRASSPPMIPKSSFDSLLSPAWNQGSMEAEETKGRCYFAIRTQLVHGK
jgi:hypothetical protein